MPRETGTESALGLFADALPGLIWTALPDGAVDFVNRRWREFTGLTGDEALGRGWMAAIHPDDVADLAARWQSALATGTPLDAEARMRGHDGAYLWFLFRANPMRDAMSDIVKWYGTNSDIQDRKRIHEELRRSEAFLAESQRVTSTGSFVWNLNADAFAFSDECRRIYGFGPNVPVTLERITERVHPEDIPYWLGNVRQVRAGSPVEHDYRLRLSDGSVKYLHMIAYQGRDVNGRPEVFAVVQDVTERRVSDDALGRVRSELARVARITSLGQLTASIAHEINQPLSGIAINAGLCLRMLATDPPDVEGALKTARRTIRDVERASSVIARLRVLFSKGSAAHEAFNLNEATREVITLLSSEIQRHGVIAQTRLADDIPPVIGDRVQLQQVILNLIVNACEAMSNVEDRPREVTITTEQDEIDRIRLIVADTGLGFDPQDADRMFEAFYTTKTAGMGIGLSVSRSIIDTHRGQLWAVPNVPHGAVISLTLPCGVA